MRTLPLAASFALLLIPGCISAPRDVDTNPAVSAQKREVESFSRADKLDLVEYLKSL
jgi:hypothetical protein